MVSFQNKSKPLKINVFATLFVCICCHTQTAIFAKKVNLSKFVEMLEICTCGKYEGNLHQILHLLDICAQIPVKQICKFAHFTCRCKFNPNLEPQIYNTFAQLANIRKSVFSSSVISLHTITPLHDANKLWKDRSCPHHVDKSY